MRQKTLQEILEDPRIADIAVDAISKWDLSQEEFYPWTLEELDQKMGWCNLERGFTRLFEVAERPGFYQRLYTEGECQGAPEKEGRNIVFFPSDDPSADERPYIIMTPGGAFVNIWSLTEGWPTAQRFNERGYHVFLLTYQLGIQGVAVKAMEDMARAIELIREKRDIYHLNPDHYITCGFSAGGYISCLWNTDKGYRAYGLPKPCACLPIYPVTSFCILRDNEDKEGDIPKEELSMSGLGCTVEEACHSTFEIPDHVEGFPPTAIFVASQDELVDPDHSRHLAKALEEAGIPCRLEVGPSGGHGFADGTGMCMEGWTDRAISWIENLQEEKAND
ncbi:MAG: alpha/beta hydrolase [Eubacterium sp.]|nr:alpha/beta hydrolase [Eubacterium sp.]